MRILHLVHQYLPEFVGGTELYTQALTDELARRGHSTGVFYRTYGPARSLQVEHRAGENASASVARYAAADGPLDATRRFFATWHQPTLRKHWQSALDQFRPDLVHIHHLMGLPAALLDELAARKIPYVVTLLDYWWVCANANLLTNYDQRACAGPVAYLNCTRCAIARAGDGPAAWATAPVLWGLMADRNRRLRRILQGAAALLAASDFVAHQYRELGLALPRLRTARWGITPPSVPPARRVAEASAASGLKLLYVGGIAPIKGVHVAVDALREVQGEVELAVAGDLTTHPDYAAALRKAADARVVFLGRLSRDQVWQALADAHALVVPSLARETFCFVAYEAHAMGVPVLASHIGALTEAVRDGVDGLLLPPGDVAAWRAALQRLVDEPGQLNTLRAGIDAPRLFSDHVDEIEGAYAEIRNAETTRL